MKKIDRTGEIKTNVDGLAMQIIEYKNNKEVVVLFTASGQLRKTTYLKFKQGKVYPPHKRYAEEITPDYCEDKSEYKFDAVVTALGLAMVLFIGGAIYGIWKLIELMM